jgi:hypothetical protein
MRQGAPQPWGDAPSPHARTPAVTIVLALEAAPDVAIDCIDEGEAKRLGQWLTAHDDYVDLVSRAQDLADRDRAA